MLYHTAMFKLMRRGILFQYLIFHKRGVNFSLLPISVVTERIFHDDFLFSKELIYKSQIHCKLLTFGNL